MRALREEVGFPSTGSAAGDEELLDRYMLHEQRLSEGLCPNDGITHLVVTGPFDRECPKCGFHQGGNVRYDPKTGLEAKR